MLAEYLAFFRPPESVPLQQVKKMMREGNNTGYAQCLVSSRVPHEIEMLSDALVSKFVTNRDVLLGKVCSSWCHWSTDLPRKTGQCYSLR